jgi:pimeloyl-ACP methyl ester carboxylesterase
VKRLPLENISFDRSTGVASFAIMGIPGEPTFKGTLVAGVISGDFKQREIVAPFELKRGTVVRRIARPQDPKPPFPYESEQVKIEVRPSEKSPAFTLAGTITRPKGDGPFPTAILITGSGSQNRDEELMDHRPFAVLADDLSRAGLLVLRCDDRGVGDSGGDPFYATTADLADDAEACLRFLKDRKDVGPIGLIGHSEGAIIAPIVAARNQDVKFIVMLAGPGVRGRELLVRQNELLMSASGASDDDARKIAGLAGELFDSIGANAPGEQVTLQMEKLLTAQLAIVPGARVGDAEGAKDAANTPRMNPDSAEFKAQVEQGVRSLYTPWFKYFLNLDPADALSKVKCPVLALNGDYDVQVDADQNLSAIEQALKQAGNTDFTATKMEGMNHLFQHCADDSPGKSAGSPARYALIDETMNRAVLNSIRGWIGKRFLNTAHESAPPTAGTK